jgi:hypothetical protein
MQLSEIQQLIDRLMVSQAELVKLMGSMRDENVKKKGIKQMMKEQDRLVSSMKQDMFFCFIDTSVRTHRI